MSKRKDPVGRDTAATKTTVEDRVGVGSGISRTSKIRVGNGREKDQYQGQEQDKRRK